MSPSVEVEVHRISYAPGASGGGERPIFVLSLASTPAMAISAPPSGPLSVIELFEGLSAAVKVRTISGGLPITVEPSAGSAVFSSEWAKAPAGRSRSKATTKHAPATRRRRGLMSMARSLGMEARGCIGRGEIDRGRMGGDDPARTSRVNERVRPRPPNGSVSRIVSRRAARMSPRPSRPRSFQATSTSARPECGRDSVAGGRRRRVRVHSLPDGLVRTAPRGEHLPREGARRCGC